jgi:hypothetical protein
MKTAHGRTAKLRVSAVTAIALLILICALSARRLMQVDRGKEKPQHLAGLLPSHIEGWVVKDLPLGPTEATSAKVREVLKFDDYCHREFRRNTTSISVYAAYWKPGKPARGLVGEHTPDICWVTAGCELLAEFSEANVVLAGRRYRDAEWRRFRMQDGSITEVLFWHIAGKHVLHFDQSSPMRWFRDAWREISVSGREQYFIRLTSNRPILELIQEWEIGAILQELGNHTLAMPTDE